jgi:hypothetical protein
VIGEESVPGGIAASLFGALDETGGFDSLIGFVAICSNEEFELPPYFCQFDTTTDFNLSTLAAEHKVNGLRLEVVELAAVKEMLESEIARRDQILAETRAWVEQLNDNKRRLESEASELTAKFEAISEQLIEIKRSFVWRVAKFLRFV